MEALSFWFWAWCVIGLINLACTFKDGSTITALATIASIYFALEHWYKAFPG